MFVIKAELHMTSDTWMSYRKYLHGDLATLNLYFQEPSLRTVERVCGSMNNDNHQYHQSILYGRMMD